MLKRIKRGFAFFVADKGYDAESIRRVLHRKGKQALIKHREFKASCKEENQAICKALYDKRNIIESIISAIKRKYGAYIRSRYWGRQFREIIAKHFLYNLERAIKSLLHSLALFTKNIVMGICKIDLLEVSYVTVDMTYSIFHKSSQKVMSFFHRRYY
jgi:transposase